MLLSCVLLLVLQMRAMEMAFNADNVRDLLTGTTWGHGLITLLLSIVVAACSYVLTLPMLVQVCTVSAVAVAMGGLGHPAADEAWPIASRVFDALHVLGVGAWIGGLFLVWRYAPHEHHAKAWTRFSAVATVAAPVVVLTGFASALRRLAGASAPEMFGSSYGKLLLLKIAVAFAILGFGAAHRQATIASRRPNERGVRMELAFALLVFVVTSMLTGSAPPGE